MNRKVVLLSLIFVFKLCFAFSQNGKPVASVMFYNVENLFDTHDDPLTNDEEFLPTGARRWTTYRLNAKLNNIAKVIVNTGNWEPPAVVGLCEIENRYVLERLVSQPALKNWNYRIIHKNSPDERGIDVAVIFREDIFYPLYYQYFLPVPEGAEIPKTREILYVHGILAGIDTVHLFFNHWPSRYSGLMETRGMRQQAAARLYNEVVKLQSKFSNPLIVIMGDFNDQPDDDSMVKYLRASLYPGNNPSQLYNLSYSWQKKGKGTLKHQALWNVLDQIIVNETMLNAENKLFSRPEDAEIVEASFLFMKDDRYNGMKLFRTYEGFRYQGGYADHLPVKLMIRKSE